MVVYIVLGILVMLFWLAAGLGLVKLSPEIYFFLVCGAMFPAAIAKVIEIVQKGAKGVFDTTIDVLWLGWVLYIWYASMVGVDRIAQGLSPIHPDNIETNYLHVLYSVLAGLAAAVVLVYARDFYLKRRFRNENRQIHKTVLKSR